MKEKLDKFEKVLGNISVEIKENYTTLNTQIPKQEEVL